jgi:hypothetical protein
MAISCGARSCLSIFLSYDRGPLTLPLARACLAKANPAEEAFKQATQGGGSAVPLPRKLDLISSCSSINSKAPGKRVRGLCNRDGLPSAPRGALSRNTRIEFRDIGFAYRPNEPIISHMSLSVARIYHELSAPLRYAGRRPRHAAIRRPASAHRSWPAP